jgi:hypothetical protein
LESPNQLTPKKSGILKVDLEKFLLLFLLWTADLVFIILHVIHKNTDLLPKSLYSLSLDRGYAEFFQYTKELWIFLILITLAITLRQRLYAIFSFLFLYFLIDDSVELHENLGKFLAEWFNFEPAFGLRAVDFGELLVFIIFGGVFFVSIALFYFLSDQSARRVARLLLGLLGLLAGFGVLLDMIGISASDSGIARILVILEEGGEMVVMSAITWFLFRLTPHSGMR